MAVARCELLVDEIDWIVGIVEREPASPRKRHALRELKRSQAAAHDSLSRERAHTAKLRAGYRTAAGKDTEPLDYGQRKR